MEEGRRESELGTHGARIPDPESRNFRHSELGPHRSPDCRSGCEVSEISETNRDIKSMDNKDEKTIVQTVLETSKTNRDNKAIKA